MKRLLLALPWLLLAFQPAAAQMSNPGLDSGQVAAIAAQAAPVKSVAGKQGDVTLTAPGDVSGFNSAASAASPVKTVNTQTGDTSVGTVKQVNGLTPDGSGAVALAPANITGFGAAAQAAVAGACANGQVIGTTGSALACQSVTAFVSGFTSSSPGTVANLISTAPCNSGRVAMYAVVSDLWANGSSSNNTNEVMRCGNTGTLYYWLPVRANAAQTSSCSGTMTLTPLVTPPTLVCTAGALLSALTFSLSSTNAYCGEVMNLSTTLLTLNLNTITLTGLIGGTSKLLGVGGYQAVYTCTGGTAGWQYFP